MSLKSKNQTGANTWELEIESTGEQFENAIQAVYLKQRGRIQVPGFRKGKATRKMIEKLYGETCFYDDAINGMVQQVVTPVIMEEGLDLVDAPVLDVISISKESGVVYKAVCTVKPEITLGQYKGIEVEKATREVTDEDVDAELKRQQEKNGRLITIDDRAAENGDTVNIDFKGFMDGKAFEGGAEDGFDLKLGSGSFIPGFEDQVVGHKTGEEFTINVVFPENYQMEELAGKPAEFEIKLNEIKTLELPALDDDFAMDVSEFDTLDEYKADLRKNLEERAVRNAEVVTENRIYDKLAEMVEGEIPEVMYEKEIDRLVQDFTMRLSQQGLDLPMYLSFTGSDEKSFRETYREQAVKAVKIRLALEKIAKDENVEVTDDEVNDEAKRIGERFGLTPERVFGIVNPADLRQDVLVTKAGKLVKEAAVLK
ncbi:MAG: trigger factor [Oscillospiraceae bacterium]|nr:trigger factor [Oscillospiraceae bacterium]